MFLGKLFVAALVLATASSSVAGALLSSAKISIKDGFEMSQGASSLASVRSATMLRGSHLSMSQKSLTFQPRSFSQVAGYPQCAASDERAILAGAACVICLTEGTCDETTCVAARPDGVSESQFFICPEGECCMRIIFDSNDQISALVIDGLFYESGNVEIDVTKCPPCAVLGDNAQCASVTVPNVDASPGAEAVCA